jgi:hypothetical protein
MSISILCERCRSMPEPFGDQQGLLPRRYQVGHVAVPRIVKPDSSKPAPHNTPIEHLAHGLGVERAAVDPGENEVALVSPQLASQ